MKNIIINKEGKIELIIDQIILEYFNSICIFG